MSPTQHGKYWHDLAQKRIVALRDAEAKIKRMKKEHRAEVSNFLARLRRANAAMTRVRNCANDLPRIY